MVVLTKLSTRTLHLNQVVTGLIVLGVAVPISCN
jgi:hypothetical protein